MMVPGTAAADQCFIWWQPAFLLTLQMAIDGQRYAEFCVRRLSIYPKPVFLYTNIACVRTILTKNNQKLIIFLLTQHNSRGKLVPEIWFLRWMVISKCPGLKHVRFKGPLSPTTGRIDPAARLVAAFLLGFYGLLHRDDPLSEQIKSRNVHYIACLHIPSKHWWLYSLLQHLMYWCKRRRIWVLW